MSFKNLQEAVQYLNDLPVTTRWSDAGMINQKGQLLSMRRKDGTRFMHRELVTSQSGKELDDAVLKKGFIRINPPQGVLHIAVEPTAAQYQTIGRYMNELQGNRRHLSLNGGGYQYWKEYAPDVKGDFILNNIKRYYEGKELRIPVGVGSERKEFEDLLDKLNESVLEDVYYETVLEVAEEFHANPKGHQDWLLLKFETVKPLWDAFIRDGIVKYLKPMEKIAQLVVHNIKRLYANTILTGHTEIDPTSEDHEEWGFHDKGDDIMEDFADFIVDDYGQPRISDYAMDDLMSDAEELQEEDDPSKQIVIVDRAFNRMHQRSDISKHFIEGGNSTLDELSGGRE